MKVCAQLYTAILIQWDTLVIFCLNLSCLKGADILLKSSILCLCTGSAWMELTSLIAAHMVLHFAFVFKTALRMHQCFGCY